MLFVTVLFFSCGSEPKETEAEKAADEITNSINDAIDGIDGGSQELKDAIKGMANAVSDGSAKDVKIVNFREMKELLPGKIGGLELKDSEGSTSGAFGFKASTVTAKFANDDNSKNVKLDMVDTGGIGKAFLGAVPWTTMEMDKETSSGYEKTTEYKGNKAFEKYNNKNKTGNLAVLVGERFVVTLEGRGLTMDELKDGMDDVSFKQLIKLGEKAE